MILGCGVNRHVKASHAEQVVAQAPVLGPVHEGGRSALSIPIPRLAPQQRSGVAWKKLTHSRRAKRDTSTRRRAYLWDKSGWGGSTDYVANRCLQHQVVVK